MWMLKRLDLDGNEKVIEVFLEKPSMLDIKGLINQPEQGVHSTEYVQALLDSNPQKGDAYGDWYEWHELTQVEAVTEINQQKFFKTKSPKVGVLGWEVYQYAQNGIDREGFRANGCVSTGESNLYIFYIRDGERFFEVIDERNALNKILYRENIAMVAPLPLV